jgi:hypothetical protein
VWYHATPKIRLQLNLSNRVLNQSRMLSFSSLSSLQSNKKNKLQKQTRTSLRIQRKVRKPNNRMTTSPKSRTLTIITRWTQANPRILMRTLKVQSPIWLMQAQFCSLFRTPLWSHQRWNCNLISWPRSWSLRRTGDLNCRTKLNSSRILLTNNKGKVLKNSRKSLPRSTPATYLDLLIMTPWSLNFTCVVSFVYHLDPPFR